MSATFIYLEPGEKVDVVIAQHVFAKTTMGIKSRLLTVRKGRKKSSNLRRLSAAVSMYHKKARYGESLPLQTKHDKKSFKDMPNIQFDTPQGFL